MNLRHPLRSNIKVWMGVSVPLFLTCWFLRGGKDGDMPMWELWRVFFTHDYICSTGEMLTGFGVCTLVFAVPTIVVGWILQFPLCAVWDYFGRERRRDESRIA